MAKPLRFSKCRRLLREGMRLYRKKSAQLTPQERIFFENSLERLDQALLAKDRELATAAATTVDHFIKSHFPKNFFDHTKELVGATLFAIIFAVLIRDLWFELYEVPTGSMRPTVEEKDRLVVSKTNFGLHLPFTRDLLFFDKDYIQRAGIVVFTVEDMDVADSDTHYFYLFPGKKRFIKRCMAKPGDTVYFYGGRLYGIDEAGNPIGNLAEDRFLQKIGIERIDFIPYITFEGRVNVEDPLAQGVYGKAIFSQMNCPVAYLEMVGGGVSGKFFDGTTWIREELKQISAPHTKPKAFADLWGLGNYAMARLLTPDEVTRFYPEYKKENQTALYLELRHTPNLTSPAPQARMSDTGAIYPALSSQISLIPLSQRHLEAIQKNLFTARFVIQKGRAFRYCEGGVRPQAAPFDPRFARVENGTYEFYYGRGYRVLWGGISVALPDNHPLYDSSVDNIKKLFNLGIAFNTLFAPTGVYQPFLPQRFAYFREGDLYLMGAPILNRDDPTLKAFIEKELQKEKESDEASPYVAFIDRGPPLLAGAIDTDFIRSFGLKIPQDGILALGDNYAMSGDSRDFGFVPLRNLRGAPAFMFWPPHHMGPLPQPSYPWLTLPKAIIYTLVFLIALTWILYIQRRNRRAQFKRLY